MGTVYLAVHPIMGRKAAIKVLKPELARDESLVSRFFNEARAANAIRHPNIIDIIDVGLLPGDNVPYMLMEFLEGESLSSRLDRVRPLDVATAIEVAIQTASALAAAHSKGIVHRDLKPDNLFLVPDEMVGGGERVKVLDFGIAKLRDDLRGSSMKTRTGAIMGTAAYMSPEQCQGLIEKIDHRTDVYALGIILYEMLCGAPPFLSEGLGDIIIMHVMKEPDPPHYKNPAIPDELSAAILCALAKAPEQRFQSMADFASALRGQMTVPFHASHITPPVGSTAILTEQSPGGRQRSGFAFDRTITPAPISLTPGVVSAYRRAPTVEPTPAIKQTTTFRNATGEVADTEITAPAKSRTAIAVASIIGVAAVGLAVTLLVTRGAPTKTTVEPAASSPAPAAIPSVPAPDPVRAFEPPPQPAVAPTPPPEPPPAAASDEPGKQRKKGSKSKRVADKPTERSEPAPAPPPPSDGKKNTERW
jgi:serine/threonine protein kinase